jgi:hypothetical protein
MDKSKSLGFKDVLSASAEAHVDMELCRSIFDRHAVAPGDAKQDGNASKVILHLTWLELCMLAGINLPAHIIEVRGHAIDY